MSYVPERGDIIRISFDPSAGKEIRKYRPALVLSSKQFNESTGFVYVAPITSTVRGLAIEVPLPARSKSGGVIMPWQVRSFDWKERRAKFVEKCPNALVNKVAGMVKIFVS